MVHLSECLCHLATIMGDSKGEEMGTSLELLFQKLSGEITPTDISGGSTLTGQEEEINEPEGQEMKGNVENSEERDIGKPDKTVVELERLLKALGLTNNNRINPFSQNTDKLDISNT